MRRIVTPYPHFVKHLLTIFLKFSRLMQESELDPPKHV